jgi:hypothetical protein
MSRKGNYLLILLVIGTMLITAPAAAERFEWRRNEPAPQGKFGLQERPEGSVSLRSALWRSALLPGWGEHYLGAPNRGWVFMGSEVATWSTWGVFKHQESLRRDSYIEQAQVFAGVFGSGHSDRYWKAVSQHETWLDHNEYLRFEARKEFGFGTDEYYSYIADNEMTEDEAWSWHKESRRFDYAMKRRASLSAERRATYTLYALLVTRVISLVDTWRVYRTRESIAENLKEKQAGLHLQAFPDRVGLNYRLGWYCSF